MEKEQLERQLEKLKKRIRQNENQSDEEYLETLTQLLEDTFAIAINELFPYENEVALLPTKYENWQLRVCSYLNKNAELLGIVSYAENGIKIELSSDNIPTSYMNELIASVKVL